MNGDVVVPCQKPAAAWPVGFGRGLLGPVFSFLLPVTNTYYSYMKNKIGRTVSTGGRAREDVVERTERPKSKHSVQKHV